MNLKGDKIYCHVCKRWIDARIDTYLYYDTVRHLVCDTILGYAWDSELFGNNENLDDKENT